MPEVGTHPPAHDLALFGRGELSGEQAAIVAAHIEMCAECRLAAHNLPLDSFMEQLRAATKTGGFSLASVTSSGGAEGTPGLPGKPRPRFNPPENVPRELADHPKFRIVRELGRGGMGVIYLAEHRVLQKRVALKVINPQLLDNAHVLARFQAEARAVGQFDHPNIARVHDADQAGDLHFLVMEFIEGVSLAQLLDRKGPLPIPNSCHYARQTALGLQHAFEHGMAHRDVKPHNLMLTPKGVVKILDFGLARFRTQPKGTKGLTQVDAFMGTPEYVAPEQASDARTADIRADIYSLGCTLYTLLTGRPPFQEDTIMQLVLAHMQKEPPLLHQVRPDVPADLSAVAAKMLAKAPAERFQHPVDVAQALKPFVKQGTKQQAERVTIIPAGPALPKSATVLDAETSREMSPVKAPPAAQTEPLILEPVDAANRTPQTDQSRPVNEPALAAGRWRKRLALAGVALLGLGIGIWLLVGVVIKINVKTSEGDAVLVLEVDQPDADVLVDGQKATVRVPGEMEPIEINVPVGKHTIEVKKGGFKASSREIELSVGKSAPIRVRLEPMEVAKKPEPQSEIDRTRAQVQRARAEARKKLLAQLDAFIENPDNPALVDVVRAEKGRFERQDLLPWSAPMRSAASAYLQSVRGARALLVLACSTEIEEQVRQKNDERANQLRTELRELEDDEVVARWLHKPWGFKPVVQNLYANGKIGDPRGENTWGFEGGVLVLRWADPAAPGGAWVDNCGVSADGRAYNGRNQGNRPIAGEYSD